MQSLRATSLRIRKSAPTVKYFTKIYVPIHADLPIPLLGDQTGGMANRPN